MTKFFLLVLIGTFFSGNVYGKEKLASADKYLKCLNTFPEATSNKWLFGRAPYYRTAAGSHYIFLRPGAYKNQPAGFLNIQAGAIKYCPFDKIADSPNSISVEYGSDVIQMQNENKDRPGNGKSEFKNTKANCMEVGKAEADYLVGNQIGSLLSKNVLHGSKIEKSEFKKKHDACEKIYVDYHKTINESYEELGASKTKTVEKSGEGTNAEPVDTP